MSKIEERIKSDQTMSPSYFIYESRNELRDLFVKTLGHTAPIIRSSMIVAYTRAIDDVIKLLNEAEKSQKEKTDASTKPD